MIKFIASFLGVLFFGLTHANEAVQSTSGQISTSYSEEKASENNQKYEVDNYYFNSSLTIPIENFKYLGASLDVDGLFKTKKFNRGETEGSYKERFEIWSGDLSIFLRDPTFAGIKIGYSAFHEQGEWREKSGGIINQDKESSNKKNRYVVSQYYFTNLTLSAKLNKSYSDSPIEEISKSAEIIWYPKDNLSFYASASETKLSLPSNYRIGREVNWYEYAVGGEFQPEIFNSKLKLSINRNWAPVYDNWTNSIGANYYYQDFSFLNSTPSLGVTYYRTTTNDGLDDENYLMVQFGMLFDNQISLKDRDRKYLFSSGYQ